MYFILRRTVVIVIIVIAVVAVGCGKYSYLSPCRRRDNMMAIRYENGDIQLGKHLNNRRDNNNNKLLTICPVINNHHQRSILFDKNNCYSEVLINTIASLHSMSKMLVL